MDEIFDDEGFSRVEALQEGYKMSKASIFARLFGKRTTRRYLRKARFKYDENFSVSIKSKNSSINDLKLAMHAEYDVGEVGPGQDAAGDEMFFFN